MKVRDCMTTEVGYCQPDAMLTQAAEIMWQRDCGIVPVVDENQRVVGMITDRDICFAVVTKNRLPNEIKISEVINGKVRSCSPGDNVEDALRIMKRKQLRRLPVVNADGVLVGILSLADLIRNAGKGRDAVSRRKLLGALREITHYRPITLHILSPEEEGESAETDESEENESEKDESDESNLNSEDHQEDDDDNEDSDDDDENDEDDEEERRRL